MEEKNKEESEIEKEIEEKAEYDQKMFMKRKSEMGF